MSNNNNIENKDLHYEKVIFCTECGDELDNFSFSNGNLNKIRKNLTRCKKTGKFNGEFCSKFFIFSDDNLENLF